MHADEVVASVSQVRELVAAQFPQWAALEVNAVPIGGTDHALFRLGERLVARMPRMEWAVDQARRDLRWLPRLAPHLPLPVPEPVAVGEPGAGFPYPWSVVPWLLGDNPGIADLDEAAAVALAAFVRALRAVETTGGPWKAGEERGVPLVARDRSTRAAIAELGSRVDGQRLTQVWDDALDAAPYAGPGEWLHGDLLAGNLLAVDGRLSAVIDFGGLGVADPAPDVAPAWTLFDAPRRAVYRDELGCDDDEWRRGRGWALSTSVIALPYYWDTYPAICAQAVRTLAAVLDEFGGSG